MVGVIEFSTIEHLKIKNIYGMIKIYIDQSQKAYSELYLFLQSDMKTMCLEEGCFLGDPSEERTNQSTEMDFLSFFEAWFLQCETFGEFARQSARNALLCPPLASCSVATVRKLYETFVGFYH